MVWIGAYLLVAQMGTFSMLEDDEQRVHWILDDQTHGFLLKIVQSIVNALPQNAQWIVDLYLTVPTLQQLQLNVMDDLVQTDYEKYDVLNCLTNQHNILKSNFSTIDS